MTDRTVTVRVRADVAQAKRELEGLGYQIQETGKRVSKTSEAWDQVGDTALKAGAAGAVGLGLSAKAAIDWETAWAGVTKTVDGTDAQMAQLEEGLRSLASDTLPATHEEIAGVAEAAGQLGVAQKDILGFTKTMIDLGESTNLTADQAATSLAQISNVMGTMTREGQVGVQRLGSTLVALGNAGASTEADIVSMATRIAGAGKIVNASESDVLALANAMSSVGIEAQLGGGVMSRVMLKINSAVKEGGEGLDAFAEVSGLSAEEFTRRWESDPVAAIDLFVQGLGRVNASGGDAAGTLNDLGLKGTENASVLLRLVGAGDLLTESLDLGNKAWEENTALVDEANKRYETTASKLKVARNAVNDAAIDIGGVLLPAVTDTANAVGDLARGFSDLDPNTQATIVKIAALATGLLLSVGAATKAIGAYRTAKATIEALGASGDKSGKLLGKAALGFAAAATAANLLADNMTEVKPERLTQEFLASGDAVSAFSDVIRNNAADMGFIQGDLENYSDVLRATFDPDFLDSTAKNLAVIPEAMTLGMLDLTTTTDEAATRLGELDAVLYNLASSGNAQQASTFFNEFARAAEEQGVSVDELKTKLPQYAEFLAGVSNEQALAAGTSTDVADGLGEVATEAEQAEQSTKDFTDSLTEMNNAALGSRGAARDVAQALADAKIAAEEGAAGLNKTKTAFDLTTEAGRENEAALDNVAQAMNDQITANQEAGASQGELDKTLRSSREELYNTARRFGLSEEAARAYVGEVLGIPTARPTAVKITGVEEAKKAAQRFQSYINGLHGKDVRVNVRYNAGALPNGGRDLTGGVTRASGGPVWGPGTGTSDEVPILASNGEYVIRAAAVQHYGLGFLDRVNAARFANGGYVSGVPAPAAPAALTGPLQIEGVLDLGNGLKGMVRGVISESALAATRSRD